ncbi:MAG: PAS domain S-box protein, partial [Methanopyri archaeon]|nr:PAS domain S-box protein [Methanopyri archaeon]
GMVNIMRDVSARRRVEIEIRNLSFFPSENPNPVMRIAQDGTLLYANAACQSLFKKCGCKVDKHVKCERWYELVETSLKKDTSITEDFEYGGKVYSFVFAPVSKAEYVNIYAREITERKQAEKRFREFFEHQPEYCYMVSTEGMVLDVNQAALEVLGYTKEELVGKSLATIYAPESLDRMKELLVKWKKSGTLKDEEMVINTRSGERRTVLLSANSIKDAKGNVLQSISVQRDITERKLIEQELLDFRKTLEHVVEERTAELRDAKEGLEFLSRTAMGFVQLGPGDDLWRYIGERLSELIGDSVVFISSYDDESESFTCKTVLGLGKKTRKLTELLGREPEGTIIPITPAARDGLKAGMLQNVEGGLHELSCESIPKQVCARIEKLINMGQMYAMGLVREGVLFGSVTFVLRGNNTLKDTDLIETFVNQASVAVQRRLMEEELRK